MTQTNSGDGKGGAGAENPLLGLAQTYAQLLGSFGKAWQGLLLGGGATAEGGGDGGGQGVGGGPLGQLLGLGFGRLADPGSWLAAPGGLGGAGWSLFDRQLEQLVQRPQLADVSEVDREALKAMSVWGELRQVSAEHQVLMTGVWMQALQRFLAKLGEAAVKGGEKGGVAQPAGLQELTSMWTEVANRTLIESQRSEEYLAVQRRLLNAALRYRAQERQVAEKLCELAHVPTRSEVDEIHRSIHDLKREVRALRRALGQSGRAGSKGKKASASASAPASKEQAGGRAGDKASAAAARG